MNDENLAKAGLAFGGGVAGRQSECGALTGGVMALGRKIGAKVQIEKSPEADEAKRKLGQAANALYDTFLSTFGETYCVKLTGHDFSQPGGRQRFQADTETRARCRDYAAFVVKYLSEQA